MRGRLQEVRPRHHDDLHDIMHVEGRALIARDDEDRAAQRMASPGT
jgi:hypothetical protein